MRIVVFDTETTGLPVSGSDMLMEQPWAVQLAAVVLNDTLEIVETLNTLVIPPPGAVWSTKAQQMHGITLEAVNANGRHTKDVLESFREMLADANMWAAYNLPYDERVIRTSAKRIGLSDIVPETCESWCIMKWASMSEFQGGKRRLEQTYRHLTGKQIADAHDAMADTLAAVEVFRILAAKN